MLLSENLLTRKKNYIPNIKCNQAVKCNWNIKINDRKIKNAGKGNVPLPAWVLVCYIGLPVWRRVTCLTHLVLTVQNWTFNDQKWLTVQANISDIKWIL